MATRVLPKTHLRDRIRAELEAIGDDTLLITERGRPLAVLVNVDRWNELHESIEELEEAVAALENRAQPDAWSEMIATGRVTPAEDDTDVADEAPGDYSVDASAVLARMRGDER